MCTDELKLKKLERKEKQQNTNAKNTSTKIMNKHKSINT